MRSQSRHSNSQFGGGALKRSRTDDRIGYREESRMERRRSPYGGDDVFSTWTSRNSRSVRQNMRHNLEQSLRMDNTN